MKPTSQQKLVIDCQADSLVVNAFAGTGKTSTLVEFAKNQKNSKIVYLAFNKAIQLEAASKFGSHARCVTTHGIAYPEFGRPFAKKLGSPRISHISQKFGVSYSEAKIGLDLVDRFLTTPFSQISNEFVKQNTISSNSIRMVEHLKNLGLAIWESMQSFGTDDLPMSHNGYLKLYFLYGDRINADIILFDEAQDANPLVTEMVSQHVGKKVIVGDSYQSMYGFNNAKNALESFKCEKRLYLTESFRFGQGVADIATWMLSDWRGCNQRIIGHGPKSVFKIDESKPYASIHRTNADLFDQCVIKFTEQKPFGVIGKIDNYRFDKILSVYQLSMGMKNLCSDAHVKSFDNFFEYDKFARETESREDLSLIRCVGEYGSRLPRLISCIKSQAKEITGSVRGINVIAFTTAHKAKGLEFTQVKMGSDFCKLEEKSGDDGFIKLPDPEEVNMSYVALTRATNCVNLSEQILDWLQQSGRKLPLAKTPDQTVKI